MNRCSILFVLVVLLTFGNVYGQRTVVSSGGTLKDKYSKKSGNLMISGAVAKFGRVKNNSVVTDTIRLYNAGNKAITLSTGKLPDHLTIVFQPASLAPASEGTMVLSYNVPKKNDYGFVLDRFEVITNDSITPVKTFSASATFEEYFAPMSGLDSMNAPVAGFDNTVYDYGKVKAGEKIPHTFVLRNSGKNELVILKTKSNCNCLQVILSKSKIAAGDSALVNVNLDTFGKEGPDSRRLNVFLNDYRMPSPVLEMKGEVYH